MIYYVYIYLREDGSPYNVGKGKGNRWKQKNHRVEVPPANRVIFPVTQTTEEWAHFMEMELIDLYGRLNDGTGILENLSDGGEGQSGLIHSEESKQKISLSKKGRQHSNSSKQKMSNAKRGKTLSEEHKQKIKLSLLGKLKSEETKQKLSDANKGKPSNRKGKVLSEETKQKMRDSAKQRKPISAETRQKMSNSHRGIKGTNNEE